VLGLSGIHIAMRYDTARDFKSKGGQGGSYRVGNVACAQVGIVASSNGRALSVPKLLANDS
jgi:hypothetical protein